jgi:phage shock protein PspC (stress-responsive transcriptional regulator)
MDKRLYRSRTKKVIAGIGGGLGNYLDIDPVIIRVIIVLITIFHGVGLIIYIILWIVIPDEPYDLNFADSKFGENVPNDAEKEHEKFENLAENMSSPPKSSNSRIIVGVILILIGLVFLSERFFPFFDFEFVFAVGMVVLGISLIFNFFNKSEKSS